LWAAGGVHPGEHALPQPPADPPHHPGQGLELSDQAEALVLLDLLGDGVLSLEEEPRVGHEPLSQRVIPGPPGHVEALEFADGDCSGAQRGDEPLAVGGVGPGPRHQELHGALRRHDALAHSLLDGLGQGADQAESL